MVPHSCTLAWKILWMEEPSRLQSMVSLRVGQDWATSLSLFTFMHWRRKWRPAPVFLPGESQGLGAWWAAVYGVAQSRTWLKQLSNSSSSIQLGEGNGNPLQYSCLYNPLDRGAWWAAVHGVAQSRTQLKPVSMPACIGEGNGSPLQCSCLENPRDRGACWAAVYGVTQSQTQLKQLSSSSSSIQLK